MVLICCSFDRYSMKRDEDRASQTKGYQEELFGQNLGHGFGERRGETHTRPVTESFE